MVIRSKTSRSDKVTGQNLRSVSNSSPAISVGAQLTFGGKTFLPDNICTNYETLRCASKFILCSKHKHKKMIKQNGFRNSKLYSCTMYTRNEKQNTVKKLTVSVLPSFNSHLVSHKLQTQSATPFGHIYPP